MTEANLKAFAASQGINKSIKDLTQSEKVLLRMQFVMDATSNSLGDFEKTSRNYANASRIFRSTVENVATSLGSILMPIATQVFIVGSKLLNKLDQFAQSKFGKFVLGAVAVLGAFLFVTGLSLLVVGGFRFGLVKATGAFGDHTKATLLATIAQSGFAAGAWATASALWTMIAPVLLIVAGVAALVFIGYKMVQMFNKGRAALAAWDGESKVGGLIGVFMKVAAVVESVQQIWASFNGETFSLTASLVTKLKALGLLDFVIGIGMFLSRVKVIWNSVVAGFSEGFTIVKELFGDIFTILGNNFIGVWTSIVSIFGSVGVMLKPLILLFHTLTGGMFESMGSLDMWKIIGKFIEIRIVGVFKVLAFVIKSLVYVVSGTIEGIFWGVSKIFELFAWLSGGVTFLIEGMIFIIGGIVDVIFTVYGAMFSAGVGLLSSLWGGFKSLFPTMAAWITSAVSRLIDTVISPISSKIINGFRAVKSFLGFGDDEEEGTSATNNNGITPNIGGEGVDDPTGITPSGGGFPSPTGLQSNTSKSPIVINNNSSSTTSTEGGTGTVVLQTVLDGSVISEKVIEDIELKRARE